MEGIGRRQNMEMEHSLHLLSLLTQQYKIKILKKHQTWQRNPILYNPLQVVEGEERLLRFKLW